MPGCDDRKLTLAGTIGMVWRAMNMAMSMPRPHVAWLRVGNAGWHLENQVIKLELPDNRVRGVLPSTLGLVGGGEPRLWPRQSLWRGTRNMKYTHYQLEGWLMLETCRFAYFIDQARPCIDRPRIPHAPRHDKSLSCYSRCRFCT